MHTVERLDAALEVARQLGYKIREEWLDGVDGGSCEIRGQKWLFLDPQASVSDQFDSVVEALRSDSALLNITPPEKLRPFLQPRKVA